MFWEVLGNRKNAAMWVVISLASPIAMARQGPAQPAPAPAPPPPTPTSPVPVSALSTAMCVPQPPQTRCQQLGGFINGGRCFFEESKVYYPQAWAICQSKAATLAQIHTQSEFDAITVHFAKESWIGLRLINNLLGTNGASCTFMKANTFWYDNETAPNLMMSADKTWIKYHVCDDLDTNPTEMYFMIEPAVPRLRDSDGETMALCQFNTLVQNYQKTSVCMAETPFAALSVSNVQECANNCTMTGWCRSFNMIQNPAICNSLTCQLFSWSVLDTCPNCANITPAPADGSCTHYNYVP